jgi:hypothetical protein
MTIRGRRRAAGVAVVSAVASLFVWGCGSGESETTTANATQPMTKDQYVKSAEKICTKALKKKDEVLRTAVEEAGNRLYKGAELRQKREELAEGMLPHYEQIAEGLSALSPPASDRAKVEDIVTKLEAEIAKGKEHPLVIVGASPFAEADAAAKAYGLVSCSSI